MQRTFNDTGLCVPSRHYLDSYSLKQGLLLIYDFNKNKEYKQEEIVFDDKRIFAVWV